jgi:hypothetical protein
MNGGGFTVKCIDCNIDIHCHRVSRSTCVECFRKNCIHEWSMVGEIGYRVCRKCLGFEDPTRIGYLSRREV